MARSFSLFMLLLLGSWGCQHNGAPDGLDEVSWRLVAAIKRHDSERILAILPPDHRYNETGELDQEGLRLLYDGDSLRMYDGRNHSIEEIIKMGQLELKIVEWEDEVFAVNFVPSRHITESSKSEFWSQQWMKKYFTCTFKKDADVWYLHWRICFAGSGGPYHPDYG